MECITFIWPVIYIGTRKDARQELKLLRKDLLGPTRLKSDYLHILHFFFLLNLTIFR